jgi:branched-chain amino acid transport system permease protein
MKPALPRPLRIGGLALLVLVYLIFIPVYFGASPYILRVISTASVLSVISLGVWLTFAIGRINLGQAAFALIGGYATAILSTRWGLSYWLCLPLSGVLAATAGTILGFGILRLRGVYFAMITLSLTEAVRLAFLNGGELTGGASGIPIIPLPDQVALFGLVLIPSFEAVNTHRAFYYLAACLLILTLAVMWRIDTSRLGWIFRSLQQNEDLATSIGIDIARYRVLAYAICCFFGGVGGSYFAVAQQSIYPNVFGVPDSIFFILYCFLGGLAYVAGPVVGAFILFIAFEIMHPLQQYQQLTYAVLMIVIMLGLPNGLLSLRWSARTTASGVPGLERRGAPP